MISAEMSVVLINIQTGDNAADWSMLPHTDGRVPSASEWRSGGSCWNWKDWNDEGSRESSCRSVRRVQLFWRTRLHSYGQSMQFDLIDSFSVVCFMCFRSFSWDLYSKVRKLSSNADHFYWEYSRFGPSFYGIKLPWIEVADKRPVKRKSVKH